MEKILTLKGLNNALRKKPNAKKAIVVDSNTYNYCLSVLLSKVDALHEAMILEIGVGEKNKTIDTYMSIVKELAKEGFDRHSQLVALGGGVVTDIVGFVGSSYKRGIDTYMIPTTTLAMVDASIGGKNALNIGETKNQIGFVRFPKIVCIDTSFLETLPARQKQNGAVEMMKTALIADRALFYEMIEHSPVEIGENESFIRQCMKIKRDIVRLDPFDLSMRQKLNFGHTIGHAIESISIKQGIDMLHGEAVAIGMLYAIELSKDMPVDQKNIVKKYITEHFDTALDKYDMNELTNYMNADKKNSCGKYNFVLLKEIGESIYGQEVSKEQLKRILNFKNQEV